MNEIKTHKLASVGRVTIRTGSHPRAETVVRDVYDPDYLDTIEASAATGAVVRRSFGIYIVLRPRR